MIFIEKIKKVRVRTKVHLRPMLAIGGAFENSVTYFGIEIAVFFILIDIRFTKE